MAQEKPLPSRAQHFHERVEAARKTRPLGAAPARTAPARPGRAGLGAALPMVGLLILGLGIAAVMIREPAQDAAAPVARIGLASEKVALGEQVDDRDDVARIDTDQAAELLLSKWTDLGQGHEHAVVVRGQVVLGDQPGPVAPIRSISSCNSP